MQHLDGNTTGLRAFSGPIGRLLQNCEKLPVVEFSAIHSEFPDVKRNELSTDQKYLYDICLCVIKGECSEGIANRDPGKLVHSRWLTTE